jgi:hypothetical protein
MLHVRVERTGVDAVQGTKRKGGVDGSKGGYLRSENRVEVAMSGV